MDETLAPHDQGRKDALLKCEMQITEGKRRGLDAIRMIAKALNKIRDQELYTDDGYETFNQYVEQKLGMGRRTVQDICAAYDTITTLEAAGIEIIPTIEDQLVLLNKIPREQLPKIWTEGVAYLTDQGRPVTTPDIKAMVEFALRPKEQEEQEQEKETTKPRRGVNPELKMETDHERVIETIRTEEAELALERVGRIAGKQTFTAILNGTISISDRDLIKWGEQSDQMVKNLAYYIVGERWSLKRALQYEESSFNEFTTLYDLTLFATARGGEYQSEFDIRGLSNWAFYIKKIG